MDVKNVPVQPVRPRDLVFAYSVTEAPLSTLYECGKDVFVYDGDVLSFADGVRPPPGHYRTCNKRGLVQLGSTPVGPLTADLGPLSDIARLQAEIAALRRDLQMQTRGHVASA